MKTYRALQILALATVLFLVGSSLYLGWTKKRDIFPLFSWSLFTKVENTRVDFAVLITHLDGRALEAPRDFMDCRGLFVGAGSIRAYYTIQDLAAAILSRQPKRARDLRRLFEEQYLKGHSGTVRYRVIARRFDPIDKWRTGEYHQVAVSEHTKRAQNTEKKSANTGSSEHSPGSAP